MSGYSFDPSILREYDIRGLVGQTLHPADALALGRAFGSIVRRRGGSRVAVGFDGRLSSPELADAVSQGLRSSGVTALRLECGPTPLLYFSVYELDADGGIMVTGSHNPPEYNGFKMMLGKGSFFGQDIQDLGRLAAAGDFESGEAGEEAHPLAARYVEVLLERAKPQKAFKVAWDPGNGATGEAVQALVKGLPGEHHVINGTIDGTFPAHHPDPTVPAYLVQLQDIVHSKGCDLGFAFDGDGDRLGVIDGSGEILWGDQMMLLLAEDILKERPGATIIADVKASQTLFDGIAALGGNPMMWNTGHSLIKAKMKETGAPFAGEMSAHLFFADRYYGFDDGLYAALRVLQALESRQGSLADFRRALPPSYATPEIRVDCPADRKAPVVEGVRKAVKDAGAEVCEIDGVRVRTAEGWWLLRASNTQDVLVVRCEADSQDGLEALKDGVRAHLAAQGLQPALD